MQRTIAVLMAALLAACAGGGEKRDDLQRESAIYERNAGAAEHQVRYTSIRNWWPVGHQSVAFEFNRGRHYLVDLSGPCDMDLRIASTLRIIGSQRNVLDRFGRVAVGGRECRIVSIHRLDMEAVERELDAARADRREPREDVEVDIDERAAQDSGGT